MTTSNRTRRLSTHTEMTDVAEKKATTASSSTQHKKDEIDLKGGPFSVLNSAMETRSQVIVRCRFDKMLIGYVRAFDKHFNLLLTNVQEVSDSQEEGETKHRTFNSVVLRGDSVVYVLKLSAAA